MFEEKMIARLNLKLRSTHRRSSLSEGYVSYENNASVFQNPSNIFPVILYFIAALATFKIMMRFWSKEERIKADI